jgi:carboxyl-terminal processing protease
MNGYHSRTGTNPFLVFFLSFLVVAAFAVGALSERTGLLPGINPRVPRDLGQTFDPFWETWDLIDKHFVDRKAIKPVKMTRYAIRGMLASLGDTGHTTYLSPEELTDLKRSIEGYFVGIGVRLTVRQGRPTIIQVLPNSPAKAAGLHVGDVVLAANGKNVINQSVARVAELVRGPADTKVRLLILRQGVSQPLSFRVTRGKVDLADVEWHMLPGTHVAHIAIQSFAGKTTDKELRRALREAQEQGAKGLILDVRGNGGGLKEQAVAVTSEFLTGGTVFIEQDAQGNRENVKVQPGGLAPDTPAVVLIDGGTASSAEIFAGALKDHSRAKLVGTHTFGTGTVLQPFPLSDGSAVLLAVKEWLTPNGHQIWHKGVQPDFEVSLPQNAAVLFPGIEETITAKQLAESSDKQLLKALEVVKKQIR